MLEKIKKMNQKINLDDLNIIILIISIFFYLVSLVFTKNIWIIFFLYLLNFELFSHLEKDKYLVFLNAILPVILIAFVLFNYIDLKLPFDFIKIVRIMIKILLMTDYIVLIILIIKNRNIKYVKGRKKKLRKHTFYELRKSMIGKVQKEELEYETKYIQDNEIDYQSDYYKVICKNRKLKTIDDLEEYVVLKYLRFYKNKKYNHRNVFDKLNLVFLGIHVIILLLVIL